MESTGLIGTLISRAQWNEDILDRFSNQGLIARYLAARLAGSRGYGPVGLVTLKATLYKLSSWVQEQTGVRLDTLTPTLYKKQLKGVFRLRKEDPHGNRKLALTWDILLLPGDLGT